MAWTKLRPSTGCRAGPQPPLHRPQVALPPPLVVVVLLLLTSPSLGGPSQAALSPLLRGQPFLVFWGVPDTACPSRVDPGAFGMEKEELVALFYEDTLGNYPYFTDVDTPVNGGLPQHTRLDDHLRKTGQDVVAALPSAGFQGLGVLRWEEWAPQWGRNREKQAFYLEQSRALLRTFFPDWTPAEVEKWAQVDLEAAAQSILTETLSEVSRLRPQALWGVSPYPSCYNTSPAQMLLGNYSGRCPAAEMALNDELLWLWRGCSALYPALALDKLQGGTLGARLYASNQIREALRVATMAGTVYDLPVFPLVKSAYVSTNTFLSEADLVITMGESVAMGAAGVIIWEKSFSAKTQRVCSKLSVFVRDVLGPYTANVTAAARLCGESLCQGGRGRCVRRDPESSAYLHLPPSDFRLTLEKVGGVQAMGRLSPATLEAWRRDFQCQWYESLEGPASDQESPKDGAPGGVEGAEGQPSPPPSQRSPVSLTELSEGTPKTPPSPLPTPGHGAALLAAPVVSLSLLLALSLDACLM